MKSLIYEIEKEVTSVDTDFNLDIKLSSLFLYFQEASSLHSEVLKVGKKETIDKNLHWVITRFSVDVLTLPRYGDKVKVKTYPGANNGVFFYRHFLITDMKNNVLVRANSTWLILDGATHQVKRNPFPYSLPVFELKDELPNPEKVIGEANNLVLTKEIRYSDIDLNTHLNNTRYIELIQDGFNLDFYKENKIKSININYNVEFKAGDVVNVYRSMTNPCFVSGRKGEKEHFIAKLEFVKR